MEVQVLRSTEQPERLVCQAGRGDYHEGYVGDTDYRELMRGVSTKPHHRKQAAKDFGNRTYAENDYPDESELSIPILTEARTQSFIEEQLGRGHYGVWEHPQITFTVKGVSRVTMAQITRHRHMTFDVQSMRYANFSDQDILVPATLLSDDQRHERYPHIYNEDGDHFERKDGAFEMSEEKRANWRNAIVSYQEEMRSFYQDMVEAGIPPEDARFVLPLGTTVNMTFSGNARTFLHLLNLRAKLNAQWEIRELAEALLDELFEWMPYTYNWYAENKPHHIGP